VIAILEENKLDAIVYPHQKRLVVPIGESQVERNGFLASITGFPAITVPAGFSSGGVPSASSCRAAVRGADVAQASVCLRKGNAQPAATRHGAVRPVRISRAAALRGPPRGRPPRPGLHEVRIQP